MTIWRGRAFSDGEWLLEEDVVFDGGGILCRRNGDLGARNLMNMEGFAGRRVARRKNFFERIAEEPGFFFAAHRDLENVDAFFSCPIS